MLDSAIKAQLSDYLKNVTKDIELHLTLDQQSSSKELSLLANEIAELSDRIKVVHSNSDSKHADNTVRTPSMKVVSTELKSEVVFSGIPLGHEFTSLVLALLQAGGHPLKISDELRSQILSLEGEYVFETFVSLSCQNCPDVVQALNLLSVIHPNIRHTMIDGALFQEEVERKQIKSVPAVFLNGEAFAQGRLTVESIVEKLDANYAKKTAEKISEKSMFDVLVVGGGPAGSSAAIYSARKGFRTGIVSDRFGGQVADTMGIENFISVEKTEGPKLVAQLEEHVKSYDVDIMTGQKVNGLTQGDWFEITTESGATLKSRSLVLATGARWREMNVPGEQEYRGKGVAYCPHCDGPLFKGKSVAVIGGGNSGIEASIDLANIVEQVTVLEFAEHCRADDVLMRKAQSMSNITIVTQAQTLSVDGDGSQVTGLTYKDRATGDVRTLSLAGVFVQIGLVPNSEFLKGVIQLSERQEIVIDDRGATSMKGVYAAGDVTTVPFKQIIISMGEGAKAALGAFDFLIRQDADSTKKQAA